MMKRISLICCAFLTAISAFAYYGDYGYSSHDDEMSGFAIFTLIVMIAYIILSIVVLVRWWKMTSNVQEIKAHLTHSHSNPKLTYLVAIGEIEQANQAALVMLVDKLMPTYYDSFDYDKVDTMNKYITTTLPKIEKLGLTLPDYVKSGEKFIDYINGLTGNTVPYHETRTSTSTSE